MRAGRRRSRPGAAAASSRHDGSGAAAIRASSTTGPNALPAVTSGDLKRTVGVADWATKLSEWGT